MLRFIVLSIVLSSFISCQKLSGENEYQLAGNCKDFKTEIEQKIIVVNVEKGVHYVSVDTLNCSLKVRYEAEKIDMSWLYARLDTLGYLAAVSDSLNTSSDSLMTDSTTFTPTKNVIEVNE